MGYKTFKVLKNITLSVMALLLVLGCSKEVDPKETNQYNIVIRNMNMKAMTGKPMQMYIGSVKGLSSCKYHGNTYKRKHSMSDDWKVVCCWMTATSKCQAEHDPDASKSVDTAK